ncbi:MAG: cytidylate kinase-like family protein [Endomicrobium sp.]|jgi:cytidylate kinase|nr:cytidylate kinase-like family protein [Endomicrobium sp.]
MSKKFAITIARQYCSGGLLIAQKLAKDLNVSFYDKALLQIAAKKSGFNENFIEENDEKPHFLLFVGNIAEQISSAVSFNYSSSGNTSCSLFKIQSDIIRALARKESGIFVGRCADYVLREHKNLASVFICADFEDRIKRVCEKENITKEKAAQILEKTDKERAKYYGNYTGKVWGAASSYHLCVNTSRFGVEPAADLIKEFVKKRLELESRCR